MSKLSDMAKLRIENSKLDMMISDMQIEATHLTEKIDELEITLAKIEQLWREERKADAKS